MTGCWLWMGATYIGGRGGTRGSHPLPYGQFRRMPAHRWAYERFVGPIPNGLQLDHLCRTTLCVNPDHLEPVTNRENVLRGTSPSAGNARKTHCNRWHPLSGDNLRPARDGRRRCWPCEQMAVRERRRRFRERHPERQAEYQRSYLRRIAARAATTKEAE